MQARMQQRVSGRSAPAGTPAQQTLALRPVCSRRVRACTSVPSTPNPCSTSYRVLTDTLPSHGRRRTRTISRCQAQQASQHPFPEEEDFDLLSNKISDVTKELKEELRGCSIYLTGMMGSGKSTVGKMLANTLKYAFFDTDVMVEMAHEKKPVAAVFAEFGEDYFRNCESEVLKQLAPYKNLVVATGGGAVIKPMNWSYMHAGVVVWLNGPTELLAKRVARDGIEKRPLLAATSPAAAGAAGAERAASEEEALYITAKAKLDTLLEERTKYYENADLKISLEGYGLDANNGAPSAVVMYRLLCALREKIMATKAERESRRNFTIEDAGDVPTMRVKPPLGEEDNGAAAA